MSFGHRTVFPIGRHPDGSGHYVEVWENGNVTWAALIAGFDCDELDDVEIPDDAPTLKDAVESDDEWLIVFDWEPPRVFATAS
jgi:hypothetical protein